MNLWPFKRESAEEKRQKEILKAISKIMSAISDYTTAVNAAFDSISTQTDGLVNSIAGITADVIFLKDTIEKLQNSPGTITPEDQALLDASQARAAALATKLTDLSASAKTLDESTTPPPTP